MTVRDSFSAVRNSIGIQMEIASIVATFMPAVTANASGDSQTVIRPAVIGMKEFNIRIGRSH